MSRLVVVLIVAAGLAGCFSFGNAKAPIGTILVPAIAPGPGSEVVIVLPGVGSNAQDLKDHGVDVAIHKSWPQADVLLTSATLAYYVKGVLVPRLEEDVIAPARGRYSKIWLAGASVGGMGVLLHEREHPRELAGLILFAPWLGDPDMVAEIRAAGGVGAWDPGPRPEKIDGDNYQREMWRVVKDWSANPAAARNVWLVCGKEDRLLEANRFLAAALPASNYLEVDGGHTWEAWITSAELVIARIRS
jgi:enterochelin esterase-like enzyme